MRGVSDYLRIVSISAGLNDPSPTRSAGKLPMKPLNLRGRHGGAIGGGYSEYANVGEKRFQAVRLRLRLRLLAI
jgi:hypothetical protein